MCEQYELAEETIEYTVLSCFLPALINADVTGLSDNEEKALDNFLKVECLIGSVFSYDLYTYFARCEITGMQGDCVTLLVTPYRRMK